MFPKTPEQIYSEIERLLDVGCPVFVKDTKKVIYYFFKDKDSRDVIDIGFVIRGDADTTFIPEGCDIDYSVDHRVEVLKEFLVNEIRRQK